MTDQFEAYKTSLIPRDYLKSNPTFAKELKGLEEEIKKLRESDLVLLENLMMLGFVPVSTYKRVLGEQQNNQR
jgi:mRNA-degrading endonuclease RelE of RelBE toxin-antitoxin system